MRVIDTESIIQNMQNQTNFILRCEEVFHDKISAAASTILSVRPEKPLVALAGPSGSGKTSCALRLKSYLENLNVPVILLHMDDFFLSAERRKKEGVTDLESPLNVDIKLLNEVLTGLASGNDVTVPRFDFAKREVSEMRTVKYDPDAIVIVEGIHMLNPLLLGGFEQYATGVYVAPRTRVITEDDRVVHPEQIRVARRILRDYSGRGHSAKMTVESTESVNAGERNYITPFKENAAIHIDTFHDYELCLLAKSLRENAQFFSELTPEFMKEHNLEVLSEVVRTIPPLTNPLVPKDSLVREFVGGSCYEY